MQVPRSNTQVCHTWVILLCLSSCICHFGESKRIRGLDVYLPFLSPPPPPPLLSVSFSLTLLTTSFPNNLHTKFFNPTVVREDRQILSTRLALCVHQTCDRWLSSITADIQKKKESNMKEVNTKPAFLPRSCSFLSLRYNYSQGHKYVLVPAEFCGTNLGLLHFWWLVMSTTRDYSMLRRL